MQEVIVAYYFLSKPWKEMILLINIPAHSFSQVPSMRQLHLHVISQDFDSKHLKNKKHWHSFNSPFFRDLVDVIEEVGKHGKATLKDDERYLSMELVASCGATDVEVHIQTYLALNHMLAIVNPHFLLFYSRMAA